MPTTTPRARALLLLVAVAAYLNSLGNGFAYDDNWFIVENPVVTDAEIAKLEEELAAQHRSAKENDAFSFMDSDRIFHNLLWDYAANSRLMGIALNFQDLCHLMGTQALTANGRMAKAISEHEVIVEAIKGKDPEKAARSMGEHLEKIRKAVLETFVD